jgi:hypothetical protein
MLVRRQELVLGRRALPSYAPRPSFRCRRAAPGIRRLPLTFAVLDEKRLAAAVIRRVLARMVRDHRRRQQWNPPRRESFWRRAYACLLTAPCYCPFRCFAPDHLAKQSNRDRMAIEAAINAIAAEIERRECFHIAAWFVGGLVLFVFGFLAYASFPVDPEAKPLLREAVHVVSGCAPSRFENFAGEQLARNPEGKQSQ